MHAISQGWTCRTVFSKTVVSLTGGFADVKRLALGADDALNQTGRRTGKVTSDMEGLLMVDDSGPLVNVCASTTEVMLAGESTLLL